MSTFTTISHAFARESLSITTGAVVTLTAATYAPLPSPTPGNQVPWGRRRATSARIAVLTNSINFTEEGTTPVTGASGTGTGTICGTADTITLSSFEAIAKFKAIGTTATSIIEVVYYR